MLRRGRLSLPPIAAIGEGTVRFVRCESAGVFASLVGSERVFRTRHDPSRYGVATMNDDLLSLLGKTGFSRREFVVTSLATGFALSVQPISAQTITTDATGLVAGEVKIPVADGTLPAYRALP